MDAYKDRCLTCIHWEGDRKAVWRMVKDHPMCMDINNGYAASGGCKQQYEFMSVEITGDASVEVEFDAWFGCLYHKE
jgi:hypothetical protein